MGGKQRNIVGLRIGISKDFGYGYLYKELIGSNQIRIFQGFKEIVVIEIMSLV